MELPEDPEELELRFLTKDWTNLSEAAPKPKPETPGNATEVAIPAPAPNVLLSKLVKSAKKLDFWEAPLLGAIAPVDWASTVPEPIRKGLIELSKMVFFYDFAIVPALSGINWGNKGQKTS